jgi:hypothetical protein
LAGKSWFQGGNPYGNNIGLPTNFVYPPPSLLFCAVFSILNYEVTRIAWNATNFSISAITLIALSLTLKDERRFLFISIVVLLSLTSYPLLINVQMGQSDLLIPSVTILSLVLERLKRPFLSAVLLSSSTLLKGSAIFLIIYFVLYQRDLRYLARYLAASLVIVELSLVVIPTQLYLYYFFRLSLTFYSQYSLESSQLIIRLASLAGIGRFGLGILSSAGIALFAVFSVFINSSRWTHVSAEKTLLADALVLMNGLIILLLSPRSLIYPYVWVILPLALLLSALLIEERVRFAS